MNFFKNRVVYIILSALFLVSLTTSCSKQKINLRSMSPEDQFEYAKKYFDDEDYLKAKTQFTIVLLNNTGNRITEKAQFYLAETYFKLKEYVLAIAEYQKLIRSMPQSDYVDDAYYKIGLCYYELAPGYALDQEYTQKAIAQFEQFLDDYPTSDLAPEVQEKLDISRKKLAKKEFKAGELYRKMGYYKAAVISFDAVLKDYDQLGFSDSALYWKGECYRKMKDFNEARTAFLELVKSYPDSDWAAKGRQKLKRIQDEAAKSDESQS